jgi:membrane protein implicated in regulation of membrane protease activity
VPDGHGLGDSRDFLFLVVFIPLQLILGIWFLYVLLGWSVWVGVGSIVVLAPLPGYSTFFFLFGVLLLKYLVAKLVQSTQKERLKHTDERVQSVSEGASLAM